MCDCHLKIWLTLVASQAKSVIIFFWILPEDSDASGTSPQPEPVTGWRGTAERLITSWSTWRSEVGSPGRGSTASSFNRPFSSSRLWTARLSRVASMRFFWRRSDWQWCSDVARIWNGVAMHQTLHMKHFPATGWRNVLLLGSATELSSSTRPGLSSAYQTIAIFESPPFSQSMFKHEKTWNVRDKSKANKHPLIPVGSAFFAKAI